MSEPEQPDLGDWTQGAPPWSGTDDARDAVIETLSAAYFVVDRRARFQDWNQQLLDRLGYTAAELADLDPLVIVASADRATMANTFETVLAGHQETVSVALLTKHGRERPHELTVAPVTDDEGTVTGLVGTARERPDTDRSTAGRTERQPNDAIHERYKQLIETIGDGVYVLDEDRRVAEANDTMLSMLGYDRAELLGTHVTKLVANHDAEEGKRLREQLRNSDEQVATIEGELRQASGARLPVEGRFALLDSTDGYSTIGIVRDLSDRKDREELLECLHEGARALMDAETVTDVAARAATIVHEQFGTATCVRLLRDGRLEPIAVESGDPTDDGRPESIALDEGIVGEAYRQGEPVIYDDPGPEASVRETGSVLCLPIEGYGLITVAAPGHSLFEEADLELGRLFIADVEAAFDRAQREGQLRERKRELEEYETLVETMTDGVYLTDADNEIRRVNDALVELTGYDREALLGKPATEFVSPEVAQRGIEQRRKLIDGEATVGQFTYDFERATGDSVPVEHRFGLLPCDDGFQGTVSVLRDVTDQRERNERLKTQRDELDRLNRINELVQETLAALAGAATREEIEDTVCERLADSELYRLAGIATQPPGDRHLKFTSWAGEGSSYLSAVEIPADTAVEDAGPAARALETGDVTVTADIESDPLFEPYRDPALEHGFRSVAVVPFNYDGVVHGVLGVYADRSNAFSERELQAFEVLGEMIGFAITATQNRRLIESDTHLELTFEMTAVESLLSDLASQLGTSCRLLGSAALAGDETLHYLSVHHADADAVMAIAADCGPDCRTCRLIREDGSSVILEQRVTASLPSTLLSAGCKPREVVAEDGTIRITADAPRDVDIRALTDRLSAHGTVSLVAKREVDDWSHSDPADELSHELTDRQQAVLTASYFGGYFDWPRDSTAEEIADSLDIASPTFHQHLRHAQRKVFAAYLDGADGPET